MVQSSQVFEGEVKIRSKGPPYISKWGGRGPKKSKGADSLKKTCNLLLFPPPLPIKAKDNTLSHWDIGIAILVHADSYYHCDRITLLLVVNI